jgi:hypothetical protein
LSSVGFLPAPGELLSFFLWDFRIMIVPSTRITKPFKKLALVILKYFRCKLVHRPIAIHLINHGGALAIIRVNFTHHLLQIVLKPRSNLPFAYFSRVEVTKMIDITEHFSIYRKGRCPWQGK